MFRVTSESPTMGHVSAGDLPIDAPATHQFVASWTERKKKHRVEGVTDGQGHADLENWAKSRFGAAVEIGEIAPAKEPAKKD